MSTPDPPATASMSSRWSPYDPRDPTIPALVQPSSSVYHVDPAWQVNRIEYVYEWWGRGDSILDYQTVRRGVDGYYLDNAKIEADLITSLIASLGDLHPSQYSLVAMSTRDYYPSWRMELVGEDGRRLLVYSSSTGNPGAAPWNVLDNGRLFAQYTGEVAKPISDLFRGSYGGPAAVIYPGVWGSDRVLFATAGLPPQLSEGFEGLLPVSESFQYSADATSGTIRAFLRGRNPIGGFGNRVPGEVTALNRALLSTPNGTTAPCTVHQSSSADPSVASWAMECQAGQPTSGGRFRFPLQLDVSTADGRQLIIKGVLVGVWDSEQGIVLLPPPADVAAALASHKAAARVLLNHRASFYNYMADISGDGRMTAAGEVILLGDLQLEGRTVGYTVATPFSVKDGSIEWALTEDELDEFVLDVAQTPVVARALANLPDVTLNLYYSEVLDLPEVPMLLNYSPPDYSLSLADVEASLLSTFPTLNTHCGPSLWMAHGNSAGPSLSLTTAHPGSSTWILSPYEDDPYGIVSFLAPPRVDTGSEHLFERIWMQSNSFLDAGPELSLWVPGGIDPITTEAYQSIFSALPVPVEPWADNIWVAKGMTFMVAPDGSLEATACADQYP